jgi:hypothetical protein
VSASGERFEIELEMDRVPALGDVVEYGGASYFVEARSEENTGGAITGGSCRLRPLPAEGPPAYFHQRLERAGSRILLPLRTSVDLFSDPRQPSAVTRAKQAVVLHDIVAVEVGFLDVSLTPHGGSIFWKPPQDITEADVARARKPPERGQPMTLSLGKQPARDVPATTMHTIVAGDISMAYGAEWHSEVLEPLSALGVDFVETIASGGGDISTFHLLGETIRQQNTRDSFDRSLMSGVNTFERDFIYKSFNRDVAVAEELGAVLQVSTLFEPIVQHRGRDATGSTALEIAVPNLAAVEWEHVLEFRRHAGAEEARQMLREFERLALEQDPQDAQDFLLKVSQQVGDWLMKALKDRSVHLSRAAAEEAAKKAISFIPVVGPFIDSAITAVGTGAAKLSETRSGIAALMKIREP